MLCNALCRQRCFALSMRFASQSTSSEPKFSRSAAFQGKRRDNSIAPTLKFDYYSSDAFSRKKVLSALGSLGVLVFYFGYLREASDLDEIWTVPPHLLTANLERRMLREQIKEARAAGKDTTLLEAQLEYVDVKQAALEVQFKENVKTN